MFRRFYGKHPEPLSAVVFTLTGFMLFGLMLFMCASATTAGAADSISVAVPNAVDVMTNASSSVTDGGDCTITNNSSSESITISSITYTVSDPSLFSSITFTAGGQSDTTSAPGSSNTASVDVTISAGSSIDCTLSAEMASGSSSSSSTNTHSSEVIYAAAAPSAWPTPAALLLVMMIVVAVYRFVAGNCWLKLAIVATAIALAATEVACGNSSNNSSTQTITAVSATSSAGTTISGLPATLGSITLE